MHPFKTMMLFTALACTLAAPLLAQPMEEEEELLQMLSLPDPVEIPASLQDGDNLVYQNLDLGIDYFVRVQRGQIHEARAERNGIILVLNPSTSDASSTCFERRDAAGRGGQVCVRDDLSSGGDDPRAKKIFIGGLS